MAQDAELDRLKAEQDRAFQWKQAAWQTQDDAWKRRSAAREAMDRAHAEKQAAYEVQDAAWRDLQRVRDCNGPRIESLNSQQETAFQNMKNAFDRASAAHESRDGASARMYADQGHGYKAEAQACVAERRQLVQEIRDARDRHNNTKPAFQQAKARFDQKRDEHNLAKADHEAKQGEFKRAKAEFDRARGAFQSRLTAVRADHKQRKDDKRSVAQRAGVPYQYLDDVWVSTEPDGSVNIYFGGIGKPNGPGHGHYVMNRDGIVIYQRDPHSSHGVENFKEADGAARLYIRSARSGHEPMSTNEHGGVFYRRSDNGGTELHITQYFSDNYHVSWDATPYGDRNIHWTNKNVPRGHSDRFVPPPDAILV